MRGRHRVRVIVFAACLFLSPAAFGQWTAYGLSIPSGHPRLWPVSNSTLRSTALAYYKAHPFTPASHDYFNQAYLHAIGADGQTCSTAVKWATGYSFSQAGTTGSDNARNDGENLILVYDWCYDVLRSGQKTALIANLNKWLFNAASTQWIAIVSFAQSNYFWGFLRNELEWGIASYGDNGSGIGSIADDFLLSAIGSTANPGVNTTLSAPITSTGAQTINVTSGTGIATNQGLLLDGGPSTPNYAIQELVNVTGTGANTFNGAPVNPHSSGTPVMSTNYNRWVGVEKPWMAGTNTFTKPYANTNGLGGFLEESPGYGATIGFYPIIPFHTALLQGRDLYNESQYFESLAYYILYLTPPAPTWNPGKATSYWQLFSYADDTQFNSGDQGSTLAARNYWQGFMLTVATYWPGAKVGKYARQWYNTITAEGSAYRCNDVQADSKQPCQYIQAQDPGGSALPFSGLPLDYYTAGFMLARSAWDTRSAMTFWQMAYPVDNEHSHEDVLNFDIWRKGTDKTGRWLTRESTAYSDLYTGYNNGTGVSGLNSIAHNTLVINGQLAPSDDDNKSAVAVRRLESNTSSGYAYADVDATNFFKSRGRSNNVALVHAEREFLWIRSLETLLVFDRLEVQSPDGGVTPSSDVKKTFLLHCENSPTTTNASHTVDCIDGSEVLHTTTLLPTATTYRTVKESSCTGCSMDGTAQYRVELDDAAGANSTCNINHTCSYFLHVLQARDAAASNYTVSVTDASPSTPTSGAFTVTINSNTVLVLQKGMSSSGGTLNIAGRGATNLRSNVEPLSYTDSGPVWE